MRDDGRQRDLLPLPHLVADPGVFSSSVCRNVRRRLLRKSHTVTETNLAMFALNSFFLGYDPGMAQRVPLANISSLPQGQAEALWRLMKRVRDAGGLPLQALAQEPFRRSA